MRLLLTTAIVTSFVASFAFPALAQTAPQAVANSNVVSVPSRAVAQDKSPLENLKPRVELNHRYSNDRAITMSEFWVPLAQNTQDGSVLFGDVRLMGDNNDNQEFNIGAGYREIVDAALLGEGIVGGMVWFDKRSTKPGSNFNQVTVGGEWLGENWDVRANGYVPLNDSQTHTQANTNGAGAGFVGNQLLVNTDQTVSEESMMGADLEVGYKLGFLDTVTDATRVYAGAYHFEGDRAEDVSGWRARIASDITSDIQLGARYQHDDVRGAQTYLEATVRFPFKAKKSFQKEGLRSRLDEAPERDIDIVSNEAVIDPGTINATLLNAQTGLAQNIIHVDNTNGAGTGTAADPFNTLAAAQAAAGPNDLIYVHRGDGTRTGMDAGITLDDAGQMLAGSGADLLFSRDRFRTSDGKSVSQAIVKASAAPVITNGAGYGVFVNADDVFVSGVTVDRASSRGVFVHNSSGTTWNGTTIYGVTTKNNGGDGILVFSNLAGSRINNVNISDAVISGNGAYGVLVRSNNGAKINNLSMSNIKTNNNNKSGVFISTNNNSYINDINITNVSAISNGKAGKARGVDIVAKNNSHIGSVFIGNAYISNNTNHGVAIYTAGTRSTIQEVTVSNSVFLNNSPDGLHIRQVGGTGEIANVKQFGNAYINNAYEGFKFYPD